MSYGSYQHDHKDHRYRSPFADLIVPVSAAGEAVYAVFEAVARAVRQAYRRADTRRREDAVASMLRSLDDRTLADIGVRRPEIRSLAQRVVDPARPGRPAVRR